MFFLTVDVRYVNAEEEKEDFYYWAPSQDDTYYVSYASSKYHIFWISRIKEIIRSQNNTWWFDWFIKENDILGTSTIRVY